LKVDTNEYFHTVWLLEKCSKFNLSKNIGFKNRYRIVVSFQLRITFKADYKKQVKIFFLTKFKLLSWSKINLWFVINNFRKFFAMKFFLWLFWGMWKFRRVMSKTIFDHCENIQNVEKDRILNKQMIRSYPINTMLKCSRPSSENSLIIKKVVIIVSLTDK
jgi:hypothetical protein